MRRRRFHRAFTFVEMCLGLVVTSMVMGAVSAFMLAVAQSWEYSDEQLLLSAQGKQAAARISRMIQDAKAVGAVSKGGLDTAATSAAALLWVRDDNGDGAVQGAECAMLEHDSTVKQLKLYPSGQGDKDVVLPWSLFTSPAILGSFPTGRQSYPVARNVDRVRFAIHAQDNSKMTPALEFTMKFSFGQHSGGAFTASKSIIEYGASSVRAPAKRPD